MSVSGFSGSSIGRKVLMGLSGLFLVFFLLQHCTINLTSVISADVFNELSHFMGTNFVIQFLMQPVLIAGVIFHFVMGIALDLKGRQARNVRYAKNNSGANSSWMSRNMIISGLVVLAFMGLHFYDFWVPELKYKYVDMGAEDPGRYYGELVHKFVDPWRVAIYCVSFILLSLHLLHGFGAAFQSVGAVKAYSPGLKKFGAVFAIVVPGLFILIALYHHFNH